MLNAHKQVVWDRKGCVHTLFKPGEVIVGIVEYYYEYRLQKMGELRLPTIARTAEWKSAA